MKIVVISHSSVVGLYQQKLALLHQKYGDDISLITPLSWWEGGYEVMADTQRYPELHVTPFRVHWPHKFNRHFYPWRALREYIRSQHPDLIFLEEEPWTLCAFQFRILCRSMNIPYIFYSWENISRRYNLVQEFIFKSVLRSASAAVVGSWDTAGIMKRRSFNKPMLIQTQYGVDPSIFSRKGTSRFKDGWRVSGSVIGYVGRLVPEKGIDLFLKAFDMLTVPAICIIAGDGPELQSLKEYASRLRRTHDIYFIGSIPFDQIPELLSALDIIVLPSRTTFSWKEQFGRILVEAMACGVCTVGSDSGAIPAVIGTSGWVYQENDPYALTKILDDLCRDDDERNRLAQEGRSRVIEHFTNDILAQRLHEFFSKAIEK
jgi:glycosyltransferase involved in cell wall biosynthesis